MENTKILSRQNLKHSPPRFQRDDQVDDDEQDGDDAERGVQNQELIDVDCADCERRTVAAHNRAADGTGAPK